MLYFTRVQTILIGIQSIERDAKVLEMTVTWHNANQITVRMDCQVLYRLRQVRG